jgi:hypothetical protein
MWHIRVDNEIENSKAKFACGIGKLPEGDKYVFEVEQKQLNPVHNFTEDQAIRPPIETIIPIHSSPL